MYLIVTEVIDILLFSGLPGKPHSKSETGPEWMAKNYRFSYIPPDVRHGLTRYTRDAILYTQTRLTLVKVNKKKGSIHRYIHIYVHKSVYIMITNWSPTLYYVDGIVEYARISLWLIL